MRTLAITAIPTDYAGQKFRSRTEANFARWCDSWGVRWHYEPEGFNIGGIQYLPDFYLSDCKTIVEVKPPIFSDELHKIVAMEKACDDQSISFLIVTMEQHGCLAIASAKGDSEFGRDRWDESDALAWASCVNCGRPYLCGTVSFDCPHCGAQGGDEMRSFETFFGEIAALRHGESRHRKNLNQCKKAVINGKCEQCDEYVFEGTAGEDGTLICDECVESGNK